MTHYHRILVIAENTADQQPALERAIEIAKSTKTDQPIQIVFFSVVYELSYEVTSMLSQQDKEGMQSGVVLQTKTELTEQLAQYNFPIELLVQWHHRPYEAIIEKVFDGQFDLIIKTTHPHSVLGSAIFTPTDWHLLRKCPCDVLMVSSAKLSGNRILSCVNLSTDDESHRQLNNKIIQKAEFISETRPFKGQVEIVNAYPATPANITIELPDFDSTAYSDSVRCHHLLEMKNLRQNHGYPEEQTHVYEGLPEDVIPRVANDLNARLVVMGTTGRTGLSAIFIGNTAEHIIDRIDCDLLALKPRGYISPLDPNAR